MSTRYALYGTWLSGPTYKVALLFSLLRCKFDYIHVDLKTGKNKEPGYLEKNRFGQVPCLVDRRTNFSLCQSGSILEYIAEAEGYFLPSTELERLRAREWILWNFDRLVPNIYRPRAHKLGFRDADAATLQMYMNDGNAALKVLDGVLSKGEWLVDGRPTIADIDLYGVVSYASEGGFDLSQYENIASWMKRLEALPGFLPAERLLPKTSAVIG
jgi:glutathione S-transferase